MQHGTHSRRSQADLQYLVIFSVVSLVWNEWPTLHIFHLCGLNATTICKNFGTDAICDLVLFSVNIELVQFFDEITYCISIEILYKHIPLIIKATWCTNA